MVYFTADTRYKNKIVRYIKPSGETPLEELEGIADTVQGNDANILAVVKMGEALFTRIRSKEDVDYLEDFFKNNPPFYDEYYVWAQVVH